MMRYFAFAVLDDPFCVWEYDLLARNEDFLQSLDPGYFSFLADAFSPGLQGETPQRHAVALRAAYYHGLETLFTLIGAFLQAPVCVPAWIPRCRTEQLRRIVERVNTGQPLMTARGTRSVTWREISNEVHAFAYQGENPPGATADRYAKLWSRLSRDFLSETNVAEYNSIKHGFRVAAGGFTLRIGSETVPGKVAPSENMRTVGQSEFGSRFFVPQRILPEGTPHGRVNFRIRRVALNWDPESVAGRLHLISMSCENLVSSTLAVTGADPTEVRFTRPQDPTAFELPWSDSVGAVSSNMDTVVHAGEVRPFSRREIETMIEGRAQSGTDGETSAGEGACERGEPDPGSTSDN
jgi:hypothetical protein